MDGSELLHIYGYTVDDLRQIQRDLALAQSIGTVRMSMWHAEQLRERDTKIRELETKLANITRILEPSYTLPVVTRFKLNHLHPGG